MLLFDGLDFLDDQRSTQTNSVASASFRTLQATSVLPL